MKKKQLKRTFFFKLFGYGFLLILMVSIGLLTYFYWENHRLFPQLQDKLPIFSKESPLVLLDIHGKEIPYSVKSKPVIVDYPEIPKKLIKTLVAVEDKNFFSHRGVSLMSTLRSILLLPIFVILKSRPWGASTITQQLVRNIFLHKKYSFVRKIREVILSFRIEKELTKEEIITMYLNLIYFGKGVYGIATAAKVFFNKTLKQLDPEEIAFLIAVIKNPSFSLEKNHDEAIHRRNFILSIMVQNEILSKDLYDEIIHEPIKYYNGGGDNRVFFGQNFIDETLLFYKKLHHTGEKLMIKTTMDPRIQKIIEPVLKSHIEKINNNIHGWYGTLHLISQDKLHTMDSNDRLKLIKKYNNNNYGANIMAGLMVNKNKVLLSNGLTVSLEDYKKYKDFIDIGHVFLVAKIHDKFFAHQKSRLQGSVIVVNPQGQIVAMVGSYDYHLSEYNRVFKTPIQINSVMKILVYGFLLENGIKGDTMVQDEEVTVDFDNKTWTPKNWDNKFMGYITVKQAFLLSRNCGVINSVLMVPQWQKKLKKYMAKWGIYNFQPSYILGANEMTMDYLVPILAILINKGVKPTGPNGYFIKKIKDSNGTFFKHQSHPQAVISEEIAQELYETFKDNNTQGLARSLGFPRRVATKSGTGNNNSRLNFVGFDNGNYCVFVTVSHDDNTSVNGLSSLVGAINRDIWKQMEENEIVSDD
jgi:penicillin-binding protein 1A